MVNYGMPGVAAIRETVETALLWGGDHSQMAVIEQHATYDGTIRDAGATPTTDIRAGLLVGKETASGQLTEWDADASDGSQNLFGVVPLEFRAIDEDASDIDRFLPVLLRAPLKASGLLIQGTTLTGHVDEFLARRALHAQGCILDDDPQGFLAGNSSRIATVTGTTDTLTESENGSTITYSNAASTTVTLPAIHPGLEYTLIRTGDEEFVVASAEGDNIIAGNDLSADSITFTTAAEHLGAGVHVRGIYSGTTLKWLVTVLPVPFGVDLSALTFAVAT